MVRLTVTNVAPSLLSRTNSSALAALALAQNLRRRASTGTMPEKQLKQPRGIDHLHGISDDDASLSSTDSENEDLIMEGRDDFQMTELLFPSSSSLYCSPLDSSSSSLLSAQSAALVVEEEIFTTCDMSLIGSIEIQLVKDPARRRAIIQRIRITCFPDTSNDDVDDENDDEFYNAVVAAVAGHDDDPPQSMMDQFASTFMETCAMDTDHHTTVVAPKSALRNNRHSSSSSSPLHHSLCDHDDLGLEKKYSVSFDKVDIHEFLMTLGDHPSAASGPPVAIDWEHKANVNCLNLDEYERSRPARRSRKDLKLSLRDRKGILLGAGRFSNQEVHLAWQEARNIRKQRRETLQRGVFLMVYDDMVESANRKMSRLADSMFCFSC